MTTKSEVKILIELLHKEYPDSKCSLDFTNPYELLVGTILSAQATDKSVNLATPKLFDRYPTAEDLSEASIDDIKEYIKTIGLYNNKAKSLFGMAKMLVEDYNGKVPADMNKMIKFPGVGRKTANVVLGNALGVFDSGITVDTHVTRLSQRIGLSKNTSATKIEKDLMKIIPSEEWVDITHLLIDHGRKICGRKPKCEDCVIREQCDSAFQFDHFK